MNISVIKSQNKNVYENIALEFAMFKDAEKKFKEEGISSAILFLWQNDKTIVLGRNQNVYSECNLQFCREKRIKISRRFTGGGAVYHDRGNLNFSFITSCDLKNITKNYEVIQNALSFFGVKTELSGRNDLTVLGKKFSGSAFYNSQYASLHHGTLLIGSSSENISKALTPSIKKLSSNSVSSVHSRVVNLSEINKKINTKILSNLIIKEFEKIYQNTEINYLPSFSQEVFEENINLLKKSYWIYNSKMESDIELEERYDWGSINIYIDIEGEKIQDINLFSDTLYFDIPIKLQKKLLFQNLNGKNIKSIFDREINSTKDENKQKIYSDIFKLMCKILH